ncbi:MAG: CRISPR-associated helicase Cas3', partial [Planctomycetaceae bacterium]|nr:CRISPR-associated helicase Cas3' [Planctomycetaceae bacterium]
QSWIESAVIDFPLILSAVLTHHLKASDRRDGFAQCIESGPSTFRLVNDDDGFQATIEFTSTVLGVERLSVDVLPQSWGFESGRNVVWHERERIQAKILQPYWQRIRKDEQARRMLMAVRSALIAADSAGSGIVRTHSSSVVDWIQRNVTHRPLLTEEEVNDSIIEKRRTQMVRAGKWTHWNNFQLACDHLPERALLLAPCGSGKTLAAWRWIAAQLKKRPVGHAVFLYPTRATAREGFQDYVSWAPEADAALMHGTSDFDLDGMFENAPEGDERRDRNYEAERRLYSLAYWPRRVFSATVDQFLAFMQYSYGPMCMLPVLASSVLVVDEVHSFDNAMFSSLKDFLKAFDVPVLCMTATLSEDRREELIRDCGLAEPPQWPEDLKQVAGLPRYRFRRVSGRAEAEETVRSALAAGKRVLWVVNQVRRAHQVVASFVSELPASSDCPMLLTSDGIPVVCYHSRFRLRDRIDRHKETMEYLKAGYKGAALGVTTQVCEMSLDIDVDLLVTEECPVASLIQRMGRCNRNRNARPLSDSGLVVVYPPEDFDSLPYDKNDLAGLSEFLIRADGQDLSQSDIDEVMRTVPGPKRPGDKLSRFLESGPFAVGPRDDGGDGFRDATEFSRQSVLMKDLPEFAAATSKEKPGYILPIPVRL